jgi:hypothetical protein
MSLIDPLLSSRGELPGSAVAYRTVSYASGFYAPAIPFKGLIVTAGGNVTIEGLDGTAVTMPVEATGVPLPLGGKRIVQATTTATGIVALF